MTMYQFCHERHAYKRWRFNELMEFEHDEVWVDAEVMCRADGFKLIRIGSKWADHRYVKGDITFDFDAKRAHPGGTRTGTFDVCLSFRLGDTLGGATWP